MIRLGLVQMESQDTIEKALEHIAKFASMARKINCSALCFPECVLTGYDPDRASQKAISVRHPSLGKLASMAIQTRVDLLVGFMEKSEDRYFLTHGVFRADGAREFYRKTHLGQKEKQIFSPGNELKVFPLSCGLRAGLQLCVETHFPEISQTLSLRGAEVLFAPHAVPMPVEKRMSVWKKILPARGYDNRVYIACCNMWDGRRFVGGCLVCNPNGEIVAEFCENRSALLSFAIDEDALHLFRADGETLSHRYYPRDRRPEIYSDLQRKGIS